MQNWNSYIGKLGHNNYCFQVKPSSIKSAADIASLLPSYPSFNKTTVNASINARVTGSVLITAPSCALPTRLPQDFTFKTQVFDCKKSNRCPSTLCTHSFLDLTVPPVTEVSDIVMATECSESAVKVVNKHKFGAKVNDIIKINLSKSDMSVAAHHMYLAAVAVAALSLVFTLGILLTDRPTDPKPSVE